MPELPEVETTARGLAKIMAGQTIRHVAARRGDLRWPLPKNFAANLRSKEIRYLTRRAKYMLIHLSQNWIWIVHLGMSGRFTVVSEQRAEKPEKHDHVVVTLVGGQYLSFNDPRRFGMMDLIPANQIADYRLFQHLGFEPLDAEFTGAALYQKLKTKQKIAIKLAVMDQRLVVGVGNIYASEALYYARIHPKRRAASLNPQECQALVQSIKKVLKKAIAAGGSSLRDYVQSDGTIGNFQTQFAVYDRKGQSCPRKHRDVIQKITQGGRSSYYCPDCQK